MERKGLRGDGAGKRAETNILADPQGPKDRYAAWQEHTNCPLGHTNYILTGFPHGTGVYL